MKKLLALYCIFFTLHSFAQNKIVVSVSNFQNDKGTCIACIFNSAAAFEKNTAMNCKRITVTNKLARLAFDSIPDGGYAIFIIHDENNNGIMDKNWIGIPKEGYGASKNKLPFAAAPKFEANKIMVANHTVVNLAIRLRNL